MNLRIALIATAALLSIGSAQAQKKIVLFGQPSVNNDAIWMALEHGYFKEQGLDVDYRVFPSGTTAFQTFRTGQGDIVMTGDLPSVQYFFNNPGQYQTFAAIERDAKGYIAAFFIWQPIGSRTLEICANDAHQLSDATGYIQGYLVAGARPEFLSSADGADKVTRFLRAIIKGRDKAQSDFKAVAAYAAKVYSLSEKATRDQWDTNIRPIALDKVYYDDFCSLSKWARGEGLTKEPVDFTKLTWP